MTYDIGVTGTRYGATRKQLIAAIRIVRAAIDEHGKVTVHEGCCTGWDDQLTELLYREPDVDICGHPPLDRKWTRLGHEMLHTFEQPPEPYLDRNSAIVRHGKRLLLAGPRQAKPVHRGSGTWQCIGEGKRQRRKTQVIYPDGTIATGSKALQR